MNPKPFVALNHFTVPVAIRVPFKDGADPKSLETNCKACRHLFPTDRPPGIVGVRQSDASKKPTDRAFEGLSPTVAPTTETGLVDNLSSSSGSASLPCRHKGATQWCCACPSAKASEDRDLLTRPIHDEHGVLGFRRDPAARRGSPFGIFAA